MSDEQRTEDWFAARLGKVTASRMIDIMPGARGAYRASRKNYMAEKVCEILTAQHQEGFTSAAMQWGTDTEPLARAAYEVKTDLMITEVGFIDHPEIEGFGASPDGLIGMEGGIEIKCPNTATHIETISGGKIKQDYILQMQVCMMCTGRSWWDFVSYDPRLPESKSLYIERVYADPMLFATIKIEVMRFQKDLKKMLEAVEAYEG